MKLTLLTSLLITGALTLHAAESRSEAKTAEGKPDISKLSVAELNKAQPPPAGLFAVPFAPQRPSPASMIWGGQFAWWNDGTFYLVYDTFGQNKLPYYLITSKDGVYWKEQGAYFDTDSDIDPEKFGVINPEVYKLGKDGPFCMAYTTCSQIRFATSFDMKEWTRYGKEPVINPDETTYYKQWLTPASYPHPDGGWAHYVYAQSKDYIGMGYARSKDGIHFEPLPPVRFIGVPEDRFNDQVEWGKGCELAGITKLGDKYVMLGGSRQGDIFLLADRLEGPFHPPAKNDTLPPLNHIPSSRLKGDIELRSYKVSGLAEVDVYAESFLDIHGALPAVVFEGTGEFDECVLFDPRGRVHFGELKKGTSNFIHRSTRNIDRPFCPQAQLRLILTDDVYEIYVDDYFIRFMEARHPVTGKVSFSRSGKNFISIKAWTARAPAEME